MIKNITIKGRFRESKSYNKIEHAKKGTVATMTEEIKLNGNRFIYSIAHDKGRTTLCGKFDNLVKSK